MIYLCLLVIVGALVYSYVIKPNKGERLEAKGERLEAKGERLEAKGERQNTEYSVQNTDGSAVGSETADAVRSEPTDAERFPYPAKKPSGCRFPGDEETTNFQEFGEEPIEMREDDFKEWWFFGEDSDKPCWSYVGTDKFGHCILKRSYRYGTEGNYTFVRRFFVIKRNIMASAFALALIQDRAERKDYFELMEKLDKQFPKTGDPKKDGPEILLPPRELLDNPSKEEIEEAEIKKEREELSGKVVYEDNERKLYFAEDGHTPMMDYEGKTYSLSCHPYEPMLIIRHKGEDVAYIHNGFYPDDEYRELLKGHLVHSITGKYHNAERFARLLTTALDTSCDRIDEVEDLMLEDLVFDKGADAIEYATYDFRCDRVLYEGVALLLGHFVCYRDSASETMPGKDEVQDLFVYALAFGYPHNGTDMYEYYLISKEEYEQYKKGPERQEWKNHEEAYEWHEAHLAGKQVLCNEFSHMKKMYKPFFRISELPKDYWTDGLS